MLLIVYPFQVALAMADRCCVMTSSGLTHHSAEQARGTEVAAAVSVADDNGSALSDPHCPSCSFAHHCYLLASPLTLVAAQHASASIDCATPFATSPPVLRLERPKWPAAAN